MNDHWCGECPVCGNDMYSDEYGSNAICYVCAGNNQKGDNLMKVWAIFSIENEYNQPKNNLVKLYKNKPTIEQLDQWYMGYVSEQYSKFGLLHRMLTGYEIQFSDYGERYRLEEVEVEE